MSGSILFGLGTVVTWAGFGLALYLLAVRRPHLGLISSACVALLVGSFVTGGGPQIPLAWPIMPFAAWGLLVSILLIGLRLGQLGLGERVLASLARWTAAGAMFGVWLALVPDRRVELATGAIPLSPGWLLGLALLIAIVALMARSSTVRRVFIGVGSLAFALPLLWILLTSFKEDTALTPGFGLFWFPKVAETVQWNGHSTPVVMVDGKRALQLETRPDGFARVRFDTGATSLVPGNQVQAVERLGIKTNNYSEALESLPEDARLGLVYVQNTLIVAVLSVIGVVLSSSLAAYAFARLRFPGRDALFGLLLATLMLPAAITKLPQFMLFSRLGWMDTLTPLWAPSFFGSALAIFLLRQFFRRVPRELEDAARIDGAGTFRSFWSVMLPQIRPGLAVVAIAAFVAAWNNFFDPLIYATTPQHVTISYALQLYAADRLSQPGLLAAFTVMAIVPVIVLFWLGQRFLGDSPSGGATSPGLGEPSGRRRRFLS